MLKQFNFEIEKDDLDLYLEAFEKAVPVISWKENGPKYILEGVIESDDCETFLTNISIIVSAFQLEEPTVVFNEVEDKDWVSENQKSFSPFEIGPFYIYGSHISSSIPKDSIPLLIDASCAFGSGQHESTRGCLLAIDKTPCKNPLDVGTGSGVLAMAIAKRHGCPVIACDNDPDSVRITNENVIKNEVKDVVAYLSDGFSAPEVQKNAPYDLIVANILARPLCVLAPDIVKHLANPGKVILSGLLNEQSDTVKQAYFEQGLHLDDEISLGEWTTLILSK